jgi:hypothetical protein
MKTHDLSPWLARGLYLFGFALVLHAAIDLFTTVWPLRPGELAWRYGFLGLAAGYLQTPTLGLLLIAATAIWRENPALVRGTGALFAVAALILVGVIGMFGLDVLAMRELRPPEARSGVLTGGLFQEVKYGVAALIFGCFGLGLLKTGRSMAAAAAARPRKPGIVSAAPSSGRDRTASP